MSKTTSKDRGKGSGGPPGKKDVSGEDGGPGSDSERLRQRILETEGRTLSDVEASGSGRQDGETEDNDLNEGDERETEAARKKAEAAKKKTEAAAKKAAEKEAEEARKAKRAAEVAKEKAAKEKRIK